MSYVLSPILVDFPKLVEALGSGNRALIEKVKARNPDQYEDEGDWDAEEEGEISLGMAVEDLVMGNPRDEESASQYGYALIEIAAHLGEVVFVTQWGGVRWAAIEECGLKELLASGPPVPLPRSDDFPRLGHICFRDLERHRKAAEMTQQQADDTDVAELLDEYLEWLEKGIEQKKDILFSYS